MLQRIIKEKDLFYPHKVPILSDAVKRENVEISVGDSIILRGWLLSKEKNKSTIIYFGGNGETMFNSTMRLYWFSENLNANVLAIDYRGYGASSGAPRIDFLLADGLRIYDYETARDPGNKHQIFIYGNSLGTLFSLYVASHRPVAGVILQAPFTSSSEHLSHMQHSLPWYLRWFIRLRFDQAIDDTMKNYQQPVEMIHALSAPVLIIHGTKDETFPVAFGKRMYEQAGTTNKHWCPVEGAGHNDLGISTSTAGDSLKAFITKYTH